jgi:hypothetical protein
MSTKLDKKWATSSILKSEMSSVFTDYKMEYNPCIYLIAA